MDVRVLSYLQREIHVRRAPFETRRHYADDLVRLVNKLDGAADDGVRKRVDEDSVDDAEDGAGGANAESEGEDGGQREAGTLAEFAEGVAEIREQGLHEHLAWRSWRPSIDTWFDEKSSMMVRSKKKRKEKRKPGQHGVV